MVACDPNDQLVDAAHYQGSTEHLRLSQAGMLWRKRERGGREGEGGGREGGRGRGGGRWGEGGGEREVGRGRGEREWEGSGEVGRKR